VVLKADAEPFRPPSRCKLCGGQFNHWRTLYEHLVLEEKLSPLAARNACPEAYSMDGIPIFEGNILPPSWEDGTRRGKKKKTLLVRDSMIMNSSHYLNNPFFFGFSMDKFMELQVRTYLTTMQHFQVYLWFSSRYRGTIVDEIMQREDVRDYFVISFTRENSLDYYSCDHVACPCTLSLCGRPGNYESLCVRSDTRGLVSTKFETLAQYLSMNLRRLPSPPSPMCLLCETKQVLTLHHLIPRSVQREGQHSKEECDSTMSLCRKCHNIVHSVFSNVFLARHCATSAAILSNKMILRAVNRSRREGPMLRTVKVEEILEKESGAEGLSQWVPMPSRQRDQTKEELQSFLESMSLATMVPLRVENMQLFWSRRYERQYLNNYSWSVPMSQTQIRTSDEVGSYLQEVFGVSKVFWKMTPIQELKFLSQNSENEIWFFLWKFREFFANMAWPYASRCYGELMESRGITHYLALQQIVMKIPKVEWKALGLEEAGSVCFPRLRATVLNTGSLVEIVLSLNN